MSPAPTVTLNDGRAMPAIGMGTYPLDDASGAVRTAIESGYRLIDTAKSYGNEESVGQGLRESGVERGDLFVVTKLPGRDHGYEETLASFAGARERLGVDYVDLYLIHWPLPRLDKYVDTWRAFIKLREDGLVRSVGVSNFTGEHLRRIIAETGVTPAVNQLEVHPWFPQDGMKSTDDELGIVTMAWSPLGHGRGLVDDPTIGEIASDLGVTPAQVILRWGVQRGLVPIPKSANAERQRLNLDVFDFSLSDDQMLRMRGLERGRILGDPDTHEEF